jgi:hypothetical protein
MASCAFGTPIASYRVLAILFLVLFIAGLLLGGFRRPVL